MHYITVIMSSIFQNSCLGSVQVAQSGQVRDTPERAERVDADIECVEELEPGKPVQGGDAVLVEVQHAELGEV
jgi:hypothetical protein